MRSQRVVIVVLCMLAFAGATHAADLQAGWYVKLGGFSTRGWNGSQWAAVEWTFSGGLGVWGPFEVTSPHVWWPQRQVIVHTTVTGVPAGTSVYLWGIPERPIDFAASELVIGWETDYDAANMRLELLMYQEGQGYTLLWAQNQSGYHHDYPNLLGPSQVIPIGCSPVFRVVVLPEPNPVFALLAGLPCLLMIRRSSR